MEPHTAEKAKSAENSQTTTRRKTLQSFVFWERSASAYLLNDMLQCLFIASYPIFKGNFHLSFGQIGGALTLVFQITASLLQPVVRLYYGSPTEAIFAAIRHGNLATACSCMHAGLPLATRANWQSIPAMPTASPHFPTRCRKRPMLEWTTSWRGHRRGLWWSSADGSETLTGQSRSRREITESTPTRAASQSPRPGLFCSLNFRL
jgi:hypothetical protein